MPTWILVGTCPANRTGEKHKGIHGPPPVLPSFFPGSSGRACSAEGVLRGRLWGQRSCPARGWPLPTAEREVDALEIPASGGLCCDRSPAPGSGAGRGALSSPRRSSSCAAAAPRFRSRVSSPPHTSSTASSARTSPLDTRWGTPSSLLSPA